MQFWTKALGLGVVCCVAVVVAQMWQPAVRAQQPAGTNATQDNKNQPDLSGQRNAPRFDADRFIKDHDKNGDGKLSKDELPKSAQDDFAQIDTNKDGSITKDELQQHASLMARQRPQLVEVIFYSIDFPEERVTTKELQTAYDELRKLDKNMDGKIDDSEIKAFQEQRKKERIDSIFSALDKNNDGKISKDEARGLWADNFAQLDKNGDGALDRQEVEAASQFRREANQNGQQPRPNK
jgi:Ca2+-binding EF-hand superfamily protein